MKMEPRKTVLVGKSAAIKNVRTLCRKAATKDYSVMVRGPSGVGKELVARIICEQSAYSSKFVAVNCAAIPESLIESTLFGNEKGAFTGASKERRGEFELAAGGVLFLDEVADLSLAAQAKVLRALQEKEFSRVGGEKPIKIDVKVIAATNKNIKQAMTEGTFREDLFYRLNVISIPVPPLIERPMDVPILAEHFLGKHDIKKALTRQAVRKLKDWQWPGNVRELENVIRRADALSSTDKIGVNDIVFDHVDQSKSPEGGDAARVKDIIDSLIEKSGCATNREIREAAGMSKATVQRYVQSMRRAGRIDICQKGRGAFYIPCGEKSSGDENGALNFRQKWLLRDLEAASSIAKSDYMRKFNISERTAFRDLIELCDKGFIKRIGSGRAAAYAIT